jgi:hypothetical protein
MKDRNLSNCRPKSTRRFFQDMRAFHRERNPIKRDEIAAHQLHALGGYLRPRDRKLRLRHQGAIRAVARLAETKRPPIRMISGTLDRYQI